MITQIFAIFKDSYNLLRSGKLFWLSFIIIALFGFVFVSIGNNEKGLALFFGLYNIDIPSLAKGSLGFTMLYSWIFDHIIIGLLLTWIVPILGLISTSTLFPDFMKEGSIDIALSKPISKPQLFALKYLGGLFFVLLQVGLFSIFLYLCLGIRLDNWNPKIFLIIPIVTLVFSYLYVVNVFWGVLTRTPIISLTLTLMFWFLSWAIQNGEEGINQYKTAQEVRLEHMANREGQAEKVKEIQEHLAQVKTWHSTIYYIHLAFPKIQETTNLVSQHIVPDAETFMMEMSVGKKRAKSEQFQRQKEIKNKLKEKYKRRSLWYVIGSSLIFELIVFALACWVFSRRDY